MWRFWHRCNMSFLASLQYVVFDVVTMWLFDVVAIFWCRYNVTFWRRCYVSFWRRCNITFLKSLQCDVLMSLQCDVLRRRLVQLEATYNLFMPTYWWNPNLCSQQMLLSCSPGSIFTTFNYLLECEKLTVLNFVGYEGCRHSSLVSPTPTILGPRVQFPSTPSTLFQFVLLKLKLLEWEIDKNKRKEAGIGP